MRAYALVDFDSAAEVHDVPVPEVGSEEVRVQVRAASINGFDAFVASGMAKGMMEHRFPVIVGKDFAGVVDAVGPGVTRFGAGDEVVGITPFEEALGRGTFAEYVSVPADGFLERKPAGLDFEDGAALGLAALAALVSVDAIHPSEGDRVLIVGATGGVGSYALQLASRRGASVIATGLPEDEHLLRELGADEFVDFRGDVAAAVRERHPDGVDALIDVVNRDGAALAGLAELVKDGGRVATTMGAADVEALASRGIIGTNAMAQADTAPFAQLLASADEWRLTVPISQTFPLDEAGQGLELFRTGHTRGKYVVRVGG